MPHCHMSPPFPKVWGWVLQLTSGKGCLCTRDTLLNELIPILEIRANKGDGKRSLCFTPSPNSKRPPDKRAKNLNYDEGIY
jgi:hypothetical protein